MSKLIDSISRKIGFTKTELTIVFFLLSTFLIGLIINYIKEAKNNSGLLEFDYSSQDSVFNMAAGFAETKDSTSVTDSQKAVASKNELLDFATVKSKETVKQKDIQFPQKFDINHATVVQLMKLPGIGKSTAENIRNYILKNGQITSVEQLLNIKGIGKAKFEKLKKIVVLK